MSTFGEQLRAIRQSRGISTSQLAELLGVSDRTIRYWESGENHPKQTEGDPLKMYRKISEVFNVYLVYDPETLDVVFDEIKNVKYDREKFNEGFKDGWAIRQSEKDEVETLLMNSDYSEGYLAGFEAGKREALETIISHYTELLELK